MDLALEMMFEAENRQDDFIFLSSRARTNFFFTLVVNNRGEWHLKD